MRSRLVLLSVLMLSSSVKAEMTKEEAVQAMKRFDGVCVKGVDTRTLTGKIVCGYQGWFNTPDDGFNLGWKHYGNHGQFKPGACSIDFWPHTAEFPEDALEDTPWTKADGIPAKVFTSNHPDVVMTHFEWMKEYGIEAAFLQRFSGPSTTSVKVFHNNNGILDHVRAAANATGRAYLVMYDGGVRDRKTLEKLKNDWMLLVDHMGITQDPADQAYLHHNGKPLVAFWGFGFRARKTNYDLALEFVEWLKNDPDYGGCSVMLGVPTHFRALKHDADSDPALHRLIEAADVVSPWAAGRYRLAGVDGFTKNLSVPDLAWSAEKGVDYLPCVFPGFSWANLTRRPERADETPRYGGHFLWKQFANLIESGAQQIYVGMFDEIDEGTQILKVDNNPPVTDPDMFLSYAPQPEDHYLWLTGQAQKMLRGEIEFSKELPARDGFPYPEKD
jgi:hypothetical protein